jgi:glycosyltransferase involved in cell wall biosynthesis
MSPSISLVIPVHNEEKIISANLPVLVSYMESLGQPFSIVLVENGSGDRTLELAREYSAKDARVIALTIEKKSLGDALREGFLKAPGEILIWYPIDLSVDLSYIKHSLELIKTNDIVIGSKDMLGSKDDRSLSRRLYSKFYNTLVNLLFNLRISDTQCVKTFRKESLVPLVNAAKSGGIVFEVELLYLAKKKGLSVKEIPVIVIDRRPDSKIKYKDIMKAFTDLLSLRTRV